jgi:hypothetical protein
MLALKASALIVLGLFGYAQRKRLVSKGQGFVRLALLEVVRDGHDRGDRGRPVAHAATRGRDEVYVGLGRSSA